MASVSLRTWTRQMSECWSQKTSWRKKCTYQTCVISSGGSSGAFCSLGCGMPQWGEDVKDWACSCCHLDLCGCYYRHCAAASLATCRSIAWWWSLRPCYVAAVIRVQVNEICKHAVKIDTASTATSWYTGQGKHGYNSCRFEYITSSGSLSRHRCQWEEALKWG